MTAQPFIIGFLANLAGASLAMLVVLVIRQPVARLFGAGPAYALWLLPAFRLVAPPLPSFAPEIAPTLPPLTLIVAAAEEAAPLPAGGGPAEWALLLLAIWAGGAAVFLAWQFLSYRRFLTELSLASRSIGAHRGLPLIESAAVQGPLALGLLDRRIIVPADFATRYSAEEQRLALEHEAVHHRRGDLWCNHVGLFMLALNWFNPLAWFAFRAFRADQELACDAAVTARAGLEERHDYARALIKSASRPGLIAACPLNHADQLKRRLKMMKTHSSGRLRMFGGAAAIALLAGASLALGAPSFAQPGEPAPEGKQDQAAPREERVIIRTHRIDRAEGRGKAAHRERHGSSGHAEHAEHGDRDRHVVVMTHRRGEGEQGDHAAHAEHMGHRIHMAMADCEGGEGAEVNEDSGNERTRVIVCARGGGAPAERAARLQQIRDRMAQHDELSAEQRARVTAALDREIARLRGQ